MSLIEKYSKSMYYTKAIAKQYQSNINPRISFKNESRNARTKKKNCYIILGNVNVLHQYNEKNLLLRVQYTIASNALRQRAL